MEPAPGRLILVADDSPLFRDLESLFLARSGRVLTAADGQRALAVLRSERPSVAVLDLHMPGLPGDRLCRIVKSDPELAETPVLLVINGSSAEERERAVRAGADDVIAKPISRIGLTQAVGRLLRDRRAGLTRVPFESEVRLSPLASDGEASGIARNLSRGGMFVQLSDPPSPHTELALRFTLPDSKEELAPTAVVVWTRRRVAGAPAGMGVQFLRVDRQSAERIEDYVYQNEPLEPVGGALA